MGDESKIEKAVCKYAEDKGFLVRKYNSPGAIGVPDRIFFGHGQCFLIEFKSRTGELSRAQDREIDRIRKHGVRVFVIDNVMEGQQVINGAKLTGESEGRSHAT